MLYQVFLEFYASPWFQYASISLKDLNCLLIWNESRLRIRLRLAFLLKVIVQLEQYSPLFIHLIVFKRISLVLWSWSFKIDIVTPLAPPLCANNVSLVLLILLSSRLVTCTDVQFFTPATNRRPWHWPLPRHFDCTNATIHWTLTLSAPSFVLFILLWYHYPFDDISFLSGSQSFAEISTRILCSSNLN